MGLGSHYFGSGQDIDTTAYVPLVYAEAQATTNTTTSSASYVALNGMSITPLSGVYQVWFSCYTSATVLLSTPVVYFSVFVDGTQVTHSQRATQSNSNQERTVATNCRIEVDGSQDVEIRWYTTNGTATCYDRTLSIFKLADSS